MNKLLDVVTRLQGRIEGGSPYGWNCFGPNAQYLDFPNVGVVFDRVTQDVYYIDAWPNNYTKDTKSIFWVDNNYEVAYRKESYLRRTNDTARNSVPTYDDNADQCFSYKAILTIAEAVMDEREFDPELANEIELFFAAGEFETFTQTAESMGMTFDEFVSMALKEKLEKKEHHNEQI